MANPQPAKEALRWLESNPPLDQLMERYPTLWGEVGEELVSAMEDGRAQRLNDFSARRHADARAGLERIRRSRGNPRVIETALPILIRSRMAELALEKCYLAAAAGSTSDRIRFNLVNGYILQRLLFRKHLTRKPVSLRLFRFWWPLITQKRILMPLVQPRGIYCFYSRELIRDLGAMIGGRSCLEIGAGDGTLAAFLKDEGVPVRATDNHSWSRAIEYPSTVENLEAGKALAQYSPEAVLCSWPPPGNSFERQVFVTRSVGLYVVIGSRYRFASGNWDAYESQRDFDWGADKRLGSFVLPPELDSAVLVFRRKSP